MVEKIIRKEGYCRMTAFPLENLSAGYSSIVGYHNNLMQIRFTVAGLSVAADGFLASAFFQTGSPRVLHDTNHSPRLISDIHLRNVGTPNAPILDETLKIGICASSEILLIPPIRAGVRY